MHRRSDANNHEAPPPETNEDLRLATAVHDVNQMLAAIIGRADLLRLQGVGAEADAHLEAILLAARDAVAMLDRLRGLAPESDHGADVREAAAAAAMTIVPPSGRWEPAADAAPGSWSLTNDVPAGLMAALPPAILREVLSNLLHNALAAMPDGGGVTFAARSRAGRVRIRIGDTGPGLAPGQAECIFEPGFSGSGEAGKGVGLAGCRLLLSGWDATLAVADEAGPGATFVIDAPAGMPATGATGLERTGAPDSGGDDGQALTVLVVDDEAAVRDMLREVLGALGCRVACARDADEARARQQAGDVDLALLDLTLPGVGGAALASSLRAQKPGLVVALMTGLGNERMLAEAGEDVDLTVTKPLDLEQLRQLLRDAAAVARRRQRTLGASSRRSGKRG